MMKSMIVCANSFGARIACVAVVVALGLTGCDDGKKTGTTVKPSEEQVQSTNKMADFMKGGGTKAAPPAKAAPSPYAPAAK
jgi:hypothetical protein